MVHIPDDKSNPAPQGQPQRPAARPAPARKPPTGEQAQRPGTGEQAKRPPTGEQARPATGEHKRPPGDKRPTGPTQRPAGGTRPSKILSLEPPRRQPGSGSPALAKPNQRLDQLAGPKTTSARHRGLFGTIGRERNDATTPPAPPPQGPGATGMETRFVKRTAKEGPVDLGADAAAAQDMIVRRKPTRRIPKPGGGIQGEAAPLDSMGSGRRPSIDPGPPQRMDSNVPPVVNIPIPQASLPRRDAPPPPPAVRGNTLAGVSAEELLGEDGRRVLEEMRRREAEARRAPPPQQYQAPQPTYPPSQPGRPLHPGTQDSSRMSFQAAEYGAQEAMEQVSPSDELAPQDSFLAGPTRRIQRDVLQTPMPVDAPDPVVATPPSDDLGYEKPVDFGDAQPQYGQEVVDDSESAPVARESAAHDEMEQRAGYLLWLQGVITREEVEDALQSAGHVSPEVQQLIVESAFTDQITLYRFLARHESIAPIDLAAVEPMDEALACLRPAIARSYRVVPVAKVGELLLVAAAWPFDPRRLLELRRLTASKVKLYVATEDEIELALQRYYPASQQTLRSPKPVADADNDEAARTAQDEGGEGGEGGFSDSGITGEGEALEQNYDPTLSGEDSGLYAPINGAANNAPSDVGISEADEFEARQVASESDLDESSLEGGTEMAESAELEIGGPTGPQGKLETGPEELDPFKD